MVFTSTLCQAGNVLGVETSQVAFSGTEQRVRREDLAPVLVSITATAVEMIGQG